MKVAVAVSGGVDSLYAAYLLKEAGHTVIPVHLCFAKRDDPAQLARISRLKALLKTIGLKDPIILHIEDLFEREVIQPFLDAYLKGVTPNPCLLCNLKIKFGYLLNHVINKVGTDKLATGHYAKISPSPYINHRFSIQKAADASKDQSYFLYTLNHEKLRFILFPLANKHKREAVKWSQKEGVANLIPEESQEICFVAGKKYTEFMEQRLPKAFLSKGPIKNLEGSIIGYHKGIYHYTVGQRRGIGIPSREPYYVVKIDPDTNAIVVGRKKDVYSSFFCVSSVVWGAIQPEVGDEIKCFVRIRQQHEPSEAVVRVKGETTAEVFFTTPQPAITPGQAAVFYDRNGYVLGGGTIKKEYSHERL